MEKTATPKGTTAREKLLQAGFTLMVSRGYPATTVDEICAEAGVSKGSFYHFFKTKEELGLAVLDDFFGSAVEAMSRGAFATEADPVRRALAFLEHMEEVSDGIWSHGCLLGTFAVDLAETHEQIRARVSEKFASLERKVSRVFEPAIPRGSSRTGVTAEELAAHFMALVEGSLVLAKAHNDFSYVRRSLRSFRGYLESLTE
jgi:TetR/AcrR family transcriptional repressor of nem operon